jgi:excisionase family DNA binding protein
VSELVNTTEAAGFLRVSIHTVRAWTYQRRLPVVRLGRRVLFRKEDLEAMVEKNTKEAKEASW